MICKNWCLQVNVLEKGISLLFQTCPYFLAHCSRCIFYRWTIAFITYESVRLLVGVCYILVTSCYTVLFLNSDITDLGMTPDTESEFYVKEIKDMVNIVQRLLADGK
jgi:hypothetical protein